MYADIATTMNVYMHLELQDAKDKLGQMKVREHSTSGKFCFHLCFVYLPGKGKCAKIYQDRVS